jgi:LssY C-terminus/PAP2 superfamily
LVHRPRPPLEDARIVQGGFSFPSGHAALSATFFGTIGYLLVVRVLRREGLRVLVGILAALLVLAIGSARVYLGVHYPSDVLAGWAAGVLWVVLVIVAEDLWAGQQVGIDLTPPPHDTTLGTPAPTVATAANPSMLAIVSPARRLSPRRRAATVASALVLLLLAATVVSLTYQTIPALPTRAPVTPQLVAPDAVPSVVAAHLPHSTETLFGHAQEPISVIFVGTRAQLQGVFQAAGWTEAQPLTWATFGQAIGASVTQRPDPAGPVTPSFLAEQPNALAFSQPVGSTFAQRHHIRIWSTAVATSEGQNLWLATASFDQGFELAPTTLFPTHQIAPDIDTERAYVKTSLQSTGRVAQTQTLQLVPPESGHNFNGDFFHTDGQAVILYLA